MTKHRSFIEYKCFDNNNDIYFCCFVILNAELPETTEIDQKVDEKGQPIQPSDKKEVKINARKLADIWKDFMVHFGPLENCHERVSLHVAENLDVTCTEF